MVIINETGLVPGANTRYYNSKARHLTRAAGAVIGAGLGALAGKKYTKDYGDDTKEKRNMRRGALAGALAGYGAVRYGENIHTNFIRDRLAQMDNKSLNAAWWNDPKAKKTLHNWAKESGET